MSFTIPAAVAVLIMSFAALAGVGVVMSAQGAFATSTIWAAGGSRFEGVELASLLGRLGAGRGHLLYPYDTSQDFRNGGINSRSVWQVDRIEVLP